MCPKTVNPQLNVPHSISYKIDLSFPLCTIILLYKDILIYALHKYQFFIYLIFIVY